MQNAAAPMAEGLKGAVSSALAAKTALQNLDNMKDQGALIRSQVAKTIQETQNASSKDQLMAVPKAISETVMSIASPVIKGGENLIKEAKQFHKDRLEKVTQENRDHPRDIYGDYKVGNKKVSEPIPKRKSTNRNVRRSSFQNRKYKK